MNPYISIEVNAQALEEVYNRLEGVMKELNISYNRSSRPHVSIAYVIGEQPLEKIEQIITEISEGGFKIRPCGIKILEGKAFPCDYIALEIEANNDVLYAKEYVSENCEVQSTFNGKGFIAHISLLTLDHKYKLKTEKANKKFYEDLAMCLDVFTFEFNNLVDLSGITISVFNTERELIIQKNFSA